MGFWLHAMSPIIAAPLAPVRRVRPRSVAAEDLAGCAVVPPWPFLAAGLVGVPFGTALLEPRADTAPEARRRPVADRLRHLDGLRAPSAGSPGRRTARRRAAGFVGGVLGGMASLSGPAPTIWVHLRGWTRRATRRQPAVQHGRARLLPRLRRHRGLPRPTFFIWAAIAGPCTLIGAHIGLRAIRPDQRRAVPPDRARAAGPFGADPDRHVGQMTLKNAA